MITPSPALQLLQSNFIHMLVKRNVREALQGGRLAVAIMGEAPNDARNLSGVHLFDNFDMRKAAREIKWDLTKFPIL